MTGLYEPSVRNQEQIIVLVYEEFDGKRLRKSENWCKEKIGCDSLFLSLLYIETLQTIDEEMMKLHFFTIERWISPEKPISRLR